jgi:hypothetical protein
VTEEEAHEALALYETDGWVGSTYDYQNNYHKANNSGAVPVTFSRWVEKERFMYSTGMSVE